MAKTLVVDKSARKEREADKVAAGLDDDYPSEQAYLSETLQFLDTEIRNRRGRRIILPHRDAAKEAQRINDEKLMSYELARAEPYFGRIDFASADETETTT